MYGVAGFDAPINPMRITSRFHKRHTASIWLGWLPLRSTRLPNHPGRLDGFLKERCRLQLFLSAIVTRRDETAGFERPSGKVSDTARRDGARAIAKGRSKLDGSGGSRSAG